MNGALETQLQSQLNYERFSADVYYALSTKMDYFNMEGACAYFAKREGEERTHCKKFSTYLSDRNINPALDALGNPTKDPKSILEAMVMALEHEKTVTTRIEDLFSLAKEMEDGRTEEFLHWFLAEQVEEEKTLEVWITKFQLAQGSGVGVLLLDEQLKSA